MLIDILLNVHWIFEIKPREALSHPFPQPHPTFLQALGAGLQSRWWQDDSDQISTLDHLSFPKLYN